MTQTALTLTDFLLARIAEDEREARGVGVDAQSQWATYANDVAGRHHGAGMFVMRHNPARILAECEAKRRIVETHAEYSSRPGLYNLTCQTCGGSRTGDGDDYPCLTLRLLARPFADHPDYRRGWRP